MGPGTPDALAFHTALPYCFRVDVASESEKDASNIARRGVSLESGAIVLADAIGDVADGQFDYSEPRRIAFAVVADAHRACVFTTRDGVVRPIPVHRVREREVRRWLDR